MIRGIRELMRFNIRASDGEIGEIKDAYFDDENWAIRYLVVDTGRWLPGRKVLISPMAVHALEWDAGRVGVGLTRQQVRDSPDIDTDKPVSRRHEETYLAYYGYPLYWGGANLWGAAAYPVVPPPVSPEMRGWGARAMAGESPAASRECAASEDSHLRSTRDVSGYRIECLDGSVGHLEDFLFGDASWKVRYVVVDTKNWWPGTHVVIAPEWIDEVSWAERAAHVHVTRAAIKASPPYDPGKPMAEDYEADLRRHYGRPLQP